MALCCTVAVLDSSCNREGGKRKRGRRDGQDRQDGQECRCQEGQNGQECRYQEWKNGQKCKCAVRTGDSYVNSQGNTFVTSDHSEACIV